MSGVSHLTSPTPGSAASQLICPAQEVTGRFASVFDALFDQQVSPGLETSDETLEQIWAEFKDCTRCTLHEGRTNVVNTEGILARV